MARGKHRENEAGPKTSTTIVYDSPCRVATICKPFDMSIEFGVQGEEARNKIICCIRSNQNFDNLPVFRAFVRLSAKETNHNSGRSFYCGYSDLSTCLF